MWNDLDQSRTSVAWVKIVVLKGDTETSFSHHSNNDKPFQFLYSEDNSKHNKKHETKFIYYK